MDEKDFNAKVTDDVSKQPLQRIYAALDDEVTPHAVRVSKSPKAHVKRITVYCDTKDVTYFNEVIDDENKTEI